MSQDPALPKFEVPIADKSGVTTKNWYFFFSQLLNSISSNGVTQIVAGTNVTISPPGGTGVVTVNASGGGGGGSGTVTNIATGTGLTGGPITTTGTVALSAGSISSLALAATAIQPGVINYILSAGWNSSSGAVLLASTVPQDIQIPYNCTLNNVRIQTQGPGGNCTVNLQSSAFPFVTGTDITGGVPPSFSGGTSYDNSTLTGWTTAFTQGQMIRATLTVSTNLTSVKIMLRFA